ncbi:hypothetical protein BDW59DRAFT_155430 [Aspergillus cavernicola]|uniref:Uncharacterized protein n=1 Tax=Aspergillus cavernicola TaxID=176166 RepID=A0ABR4H8R9_9EURO
MRLVLKRLRVEKEPDLFQLGPIIIEFQAQEVEEVEKVEDYLPPRRAHPVHSSDAISVFRPINEVAQWDMGFFAIYGSSHHQTPQEFPASQKDIHKKKVEVYEALALSGGLLVQPSRKGGLRMVWQGFAKRPMLGDMLSSDAFEFMTGLIVSKPDLPPEPSRLDEV